VIPRGQRFVIEDFDDGIVLFDVLEGATHLLNVSAAEALAIVAESGGLAAEDIHPCLLRRLEVNANTLPLPAVEELLWRLEDLNLVSVVR
jgi:PqqD family protein of HPr-rel-A system